MSKNPIASQAECRGLEARPLNFAEFTWAIIDEIYNEAKATLKVKQFNGTFACSHTCDVPNLHRACLRTKAQSLILKGSLCPTVTNIKVVVVSSCQSLLGSRVVQGVSF